MWDIVRTKPQGRHVGKAIPVFIKNMQQFLAVIKAFDDGAIDVWGFLDLQLFDKKLQTGWVSTAPPRGSRISIFNLGSATVDSGEWSSSVEDVRNQVWEVVRGYDPDLKSVIDMKGDDSVKEGRVRMAKMGLSNDQPFRLGRSGERILGKEIPVFEREGLDFVVQRWFIFADGQSKVGPEGALEDFDATCERLESGMLTVEAEDGRWIKVPGLGRFKGSTGSYHVKAGERIREGRDLLTSLGGKDGVVETCRDAMEAYLEAPTAASKDALRLAYESVPEHLRMYCGNMDTKDSEIRAALRNTD